MARRRVQRCPVSGEVPQRTGVGEMLFNELEHEEMDIMSLLEKRFPEFNPLLPPGGENSGCQRIVGVGEALVRGVVESDKELVTG